MERLDNHWQVPTDLQNRTLEVSSGVDCALITAFRKKKRESQRHFWARFGVSQSRGSRFESGTEIPVPVAILLGLYLMKMVSDSDLSHAERVLCGPDAAGLLNPGQ